MSTPTTNTTIEQLRQADWDQLHDDVSLRIDLLEQAVKTLDPNPLNDKIANDLFMPALRLLADFCLRVEIEKDPANPRHVSLSVANPEPPEQP